MCVRTSLSRQVVGHAVIWIERVLLSSLSLACALSARWERPYGARRDARALRASKPTKRRRRRCSVFLLGCLAIESRDACQISRLAPWLDREGRKDSLQLVSCLQTYLR